MSPPLTSSPAPNKPSYNADEQKDLKKQQKPQQSEQKKGQHDPVMKPHSQEQQGESLVSPKPQSSCNRPYIPSWF